LTSIKGYLEALQDLAPGVPDEGQKFLDILLKHARGMENIVSDLLHLARIESGKEKLQLAPISLKSFLLKTVQELSPLAEKKNQTIEVDVGEEISLEADSEKLSRLITNLIDNAIKYTPPSGKIIAGCLKKEGQIELFVKDTGIGIPPADLDRIFERFYRVDRARSREMGGTGLGLSIVKHIMEAHGGFIRVESEINRGTTFTAVFPFSSPPRQTPS
jgi:two-component system phosphate regulon sensor histidine kinase PhoR